MPLRGPRGVQPLRIYLTLMIGIKSSMSADKIKGPIVIFTKAKKKTLLRVIPTMTFQNNLLTALLSEAFVTGILPN